MFKRLVMPAILLVVAFFGYSYWKHGSIDFRVNIGAKQVTSDIADQAKRGIPAAEFIEGQHWERLEEPLFVTKENVTMLFSYACVHCARLEEAYEDFAYIGSKPEMAYVPAPWGRNRVEAMRYYALEHLGHEALHPEYLKARHAGFRKFPGDEMFFVRMGFPQLAEVFNKTYQRQSFAEKFHRDRQVVQALTPHMNATPAIAVSGKYRVMIENITSGYDEIVAVSDWLMATQP
ncbi:thioredoxin domain-containing protein [Ferrimonas marina]|uniref:Thiol:disulfide interchange protein DsbA n=1 Tax=Ferrimonas marina TaxID=299255 RepID=A0A1M5TA24_9GAMM|nr:hypothetical protein [Ferrimonas marina]SHH47617.1 hypothetical protein SAMN02745129_2058 [Ferrimonas marina]